MPQQKPTRTSAHTQRYSAPPPSRSPLNLTCFQDDDDAFLSRQGRVKPRKANHTSLPPPSKFDDATRTRTSLEPSVHNSERPLVSSPMPLKRSDWETSNKGRPVAKRDLQQPTPPRLHDGPQRVLSKSNLHSKPEAPGAVLRGDSVHIRVRALKPDGTGFYDPGPLAPYLPSPRPTRK
ncbi:hypothetical protein D9611_012436 [Ephemerocybe angulata]|uniref:Uncharacterized protein n=1 Tax=Ephemerocybe angulata TaxID=980116 RepID=A0A8H5FKJ0_9AGAR|nr:hypothetical protein D9611_012436 [Tulosesus angulatus]